MIVPFFEIDWNEIWKSQMQRNKNSNFDQNFGRIWDSRESAERSWNMYQENKDRINKTIDGTNISPESRVLDIGAGPGALAMPLAKKVTHVTAIEPSDGMVSIFKAKMAKYGLANISIVQKRWEDVDLKADLHPPYDIVIASFSLIMLDIRAAIEKMIEASSRYIYLYWIAGETSWDVHHRELWPKLHKKEHYALPGSDVLYNVLYQMGIYPNVKTFKLYHNQRFASLQQALDALRHQYFINTPEQETIFFKYFSNVLRDEGNSVVLPTSSIRVKIWWKKSDS
ncbi:MAG: class I SAM-dependent methyltransferase [Methanothrix sp.]|nr:class I SAM-dependent methyltransferase [Methanothrix sp.]